MQRTRRLLLPAATNASDGASRRNESSLAVLTRLSAAKRGALPRAPLFFCLFGFFQSAVLAAQELLGQCGELVVRQFALLVQLHLRLGGLAAAALAFLSYVPLVVRHPIPPHKLRPMIVAD
jgi:hypothetical protein